MPRLLGVAGPAGTGKGEVAKVLQEFGWKSIKMSAPLKDMLICLMARQGETPADIDRMIEGDLKEEPCFYGVTPRHLMQTLGTDWGRGLIREDFWVDMVGLTIADALGNGHSVVVDDVRFQNEVDMIRLLGGSVVYVYRAERDRNPGSHPSEGAPIMPDAFLYNNGTLPEFHDKITRMFT